MKSIPINTIKRIVDLISWPIWLVATIWRNKLIRRIVLIALTIIVVIYYYSGLQGLGTAFQLAFQLLFAASFMIIQFGAMFWFISKTKDTTVRPGDKKSLTFENDYYGNFNEVALVQDWVKLLTTERWKLEKIGAKTISGILLTGPPGVGKTLMMKCLATSANALFTSLSATDLQAMFIGIGPLKVNRFANKLRNGAKEYGAAIGFIDEIDAVGGNRGSVQERMEAINWYRKLSWAEKTKVNLGIKNYHPMVMGAGMGGGGLGVLSRLLTEMDGITETPFRDEIQNKIRSWFDIEPIDPGVVLWTGATNRPDSLDPALIRPGRFDRKISIGLPDASTRRALFEGYLKKVDHEEKIDVGTLVDITAGVSHAFIASSIEKDAARLALFDNRYKISEMDIARSIEENVVGLPNPIADLEPRQKEQIAYHEAGHAIVAHKVRGNRKRIANVSIIRRGSGILGYVRDVDKEEVYAKPLAEIAADAMVSLAGHEAVFLHFGEHWTGAGTDFRNLNFYMELLRNYGQFGGIPIDENMAMANRIDEIQDNYQRELIKATRNILQENWEYVQAIVDALLDHDEISATEFEEIVANMETDHE